MGILQITTDETGQVAQLPRTVKIVTTDSLAVITAAGYLNPITLLSNTIYPSDIINIIYSWDNATQNGTFGVFRPSFSGTTITLVAWVDSGNVLLPVVSNDFANFNGTTGQIKDSGYSPTDATKTKVVMANAATVANHIMVSTDTAGTSGNLTGIAINDGGLQAGRSTISGTVYSFPSAATSGKFGLIAVANSADVAVSLSNASHAQATVYSVADVGAATGQLLNKTAAFVSGNLIAASGTAGICVDGGVVANRVLFTTFASPDAAADLVAFDITCGQAALAAAGSVTLYTSSGSKQYKVRDLWINSGGTNFSGGGGDRLGQVTDGTTVYSVVPAANMQTLTNNGWGNGTPLPYPAAAAVSTSTAAGASLVFKYSGGTTDYTAGSVVISGILQRVA